MDLSERAQAEAAPTAAEDHLRCEGLAKRFGSLTVIDSLDFSVAQGELVSLLGPSGCGKTTLLRMIAGLARADAGRIRLGDRDLTRVPAHRRNVSVVFQNYALFPHLSVSENIAFGLRARGLDPGTIATRTEEALALVRMEAFADRSVTLLSGGQQQRVAVARALVVSPALVLLDEPFSALDRKLRESMQVELKSLLRRRGMTAIFVTHDQDEALAVSDRIAVMHAGRIEHFDAPTALYERPNTLFALDFVGLSTRLHGRVEAVGEEGLTVATAYGRVRARGNFRVGAAVVIGVRPERVRPVAAGSEPPAQTNQVTCQVADVMVLGSRTHLHGVADGEDRLLCELPSGSPDADHVRESHVGLQWSVADTLIYPAPDRS